MHKLSDLELLRIEMDLLWGTQDGPELAVACARQGLWARVNNTVPERLVRSLVAEVERTSRWSVAPASAAFERRSR